MSLARSIQDLGFYTRMTGSVGVGTMAIVGTFAVDLVMMAAIQKQAREGHYLDLAFTMWTWSLLSNNNQNPLALLLLSPLTTVVAIGLSIAYEVPTIGLYLALGWAFSASLVLVGWGLEELGAILENPNFDFFRHSNNANEIPLVTLRSSNKFFNQENDMFVPEAKVVWIDQRDCYSDSASAPSAPEDSSMAYSN